MSNQVINTSSVQAQFAALATDKENLRATILSAEQNRKKEEAQLGEFKKDQRSLNEEIGKAHSHVGSMKKKRQHYMQDKEKWTRKLYEEQEEIKQLTETIHRKEMEEQDVKIQFCKEMESYHDETLLLMQKCFEKKWIQLLSSTTCQEIIQEYLDPMNDKSSSSSSSSSSSEEHQVEEEDVQSLWNQLMMEEEKLNTVKSFEQQLNETYVSLRHKALEYYDQNSPLNDGKIMNDTSLDQLEEGWMMNEECDVDDPQPDSNSMLKIVDPSYSEVQQHMEMFYNDASTSY